MQQFVSDIRYDGGRNMMTGREAVQLMTALGKKRPRKGARIWPNLAPRPGLEPGTYGLTVSVEPTSAVNRNK